MLLRLPLRALMWLPLVATFVLWTTMVTWSWPCAAQSHMSMTDGERSWIAAHPVVRVGPSTEFPPYYFADTHGRYEGFVVALMEQLASQAGLRVEYHRYVRFGDTLQALNAGEIDLPPFAAESTARQEYLQFVRPLFSTQMVYVADRRLGDITEDTNFADYRVAVERLSTASDLLRERFPQVQPKGYDTAEQAMLATAAGDADVFLGLRQVAVYDMEKHLIANLVLRGMFDMQGTALGPAVRKDLPELASILDKAVNRLATDEIAEIAASWLPRGVFDAELRGQLALTSAQHAWI